MGPSSWKREKNATRMDAVRGMLRTPPSPAPSPAKDRASVPQVAEWSSPAFTRARARPSNLHSYLRSSPSFPLSHNHSSNQQHARSRSRHLHTHTGSSSDAASSGGGSTKSAGGATNYNSSYIQQSEWRSQRTQATQTQDMELSDRRAACAPFAKRGGETVQLGTFGDVSAMPIETVDYLIRVLEDRKQELLVPTAASEKRDSTAPHRSSGNKENVQPSHHAAASRRSAQGGSRNDGKSKKQDDEYTESSDESDVPHPSRSPVVRSRSYEALVQLEGILEARHQQLMKDGILEPPTSAAATGNGDTGDNDDDDDDETAAPKMVMTDIQEEIRKMHRSLRQQRRADAENYANGLQIERNFESLFANDARSTS